jgi:L-fuconolactonase
MRIDSHQHFWKYDPSVDLWITDDMSVIKNDFLPEKLEPLLKSAGFDGCIAVQSRQTEDDTDFLLGLAEQNDFIKGVVGWVDLCSPDLDETLSHYSRFKKLKGFRHVLQAEPPGFMTDKSFINGVNKLHHYNFTYDLLITNNQLSEALKFVDQISDTSIVIDHLAKPAIKSKERSTWKTNMASMAVFPNVFCKVSGMVTESDWANWKQDDFIPYIDGVMEAFGTERMLYGSDWPVCLLAASYQQQADIVLKYISDLPAADREKVLGLNAVKFYNLN